MIIISNEEQSRIRRTVAKISSETVLLLDDASDLFSGNATGETFMNAFETLLIRELKVMIHEYETGPTKISVSRHRFGI